MSTGKKFANAIQRIVQKIRDRGYKDRLARQAYCELGLTPFVPNIFAMPIPVATFGRASPGFRAW